MMDAWIDPNDSAGKGINNAEREFLGMNTEK